MLYVNNNETFNGNNIIINWNNLFIYFKIDTNIYFFKLQNLYDNFIKIVLFKYQNDISLIMIKK